jgi:hypothetical protein
LLLTVEQQRNLLTGGWDALEEELRLPEKVQVGEFAVDPRQMKLRYGNGALRCMRGQHSLELVEKSTGKKVPARMRCKAARCERCRDAYYRALRIKTVRSLKDRPVNELVFLVLTLRKRDDIWKAGKVARDSYKMITDPFENLRRNIQRVYGIEGYLLILEAHQDGVAHANVVIQSRGLADALRAAPKTGTDADRYPLWLQRLVKRFGFGRTSAEVVREGEEGGLASYISKLHGKQTASLSGEVSKKSQAPATRAPLGTRLYRSSRNWFQRAEKAEGKFTGKLVPWSYEEGVELEKFRSLPEETEELEPQEQRVAPTAEAVVREDATVPVAVSLQMSWRDALMVMGGAFVPPAPRISRMPCTASKEHLRQSHWEERGAGEEKRRFFPVSRTPIGSWSG